MKELSNLKTKEKKILVELYDFILGKVTRFTFDDERFVSVQHQVLHELRDVKINFTVKKID
ncbi:MAG: hypothetical protein ACOYOV_00280 [Bacteroidales bacterium]